MTRLLNQIEPWLKEWMNISMNRALEACDQGSMNERESKDEVKYKAKWIPR